MCHWIEGRPLSDALDTEMHFGARAGSPVMMPRRSEDSFRQWTYRLGTESWTGVNPFTGADVKSCSDVGLTPTERRATYALLGDHRAGCSPRAAVTCGATNAWP